MEDRLDNLRLALRLNWGELCSELGIGRSMLGYIRSGERHPSPKLLRRIESLEAEAGLRTFECPNPSDSGRIRWYQFITQLDLSDIAARLGMTTDGIQAVLTGERSLSGPAAQKLSALEAAAHIVVPAAATPARPASEPSAPDVSNPWKNRDEVFQCLETRLARIQEELEGVRSEISRLKGE